MALTRVAAAAIIALAVAGCQKSAPSPLAETSSQGSEGPKTSSSPQAAVAAVDHNYNSRDGDLYCYQGAISNDQQNAGKAAGDVFCFKYLGESHGRYRFTAEQSPYVVISCANPCETIKAVAGGETVQRMAFEPRSIIGSAFVDAFSGKLEPAGRRQHERATAHRRRHSETCHPAPDDATMEICEGDG